MRQEVRPILKETLENKWQHVEAPHSDATAFRPCLYELGWWKQRNWKFYWHGLL